MDRPGAGRCGGWAARREEHGGGGEGGYRREREGGQTCDHGGLLRGRAIGAAHGRSYGPRMGRSNKAVTDEFGGQPPFATFRDPTAASDIRPLIRRRGPGAPMPATAAALTGSTAAVEPSDLSLQQLGLTDDVPGSPAATAFQPTLSPPTPAPVVLAWRADGGPDRLRWPTGLAVDRRGALTVVDAGHDRLVQLTASAGETIARIGGPGEAPGRFRFGSRRTSTGATSGPSAARWRPTPTGRCTSPTPSMAAFSGSTARGGSARPGRLRRWPPTRSSSRRASPSTIRTTGSTSPTSAPIASTPSTAPATGNSTWDGAVAGGDPFVPAGIAVDDHGGIYLSDHGRSRVLKFRPRAAWPTPAGTPTPRPALADADADARWTAGAAPATATDAHRPLTAHGPRE